jgi:Flp pilus assembly protein TadD
MRVAIILALLTGCASKRIEEAPKWRDHRDEVRLDLIQHFLDKGDSSRALALIASMRQDGIDNPILDLQQGVAFRDEGMFAEAERLLLRASKRMPREDGPLHALCVLYADEQRTDEAIQSCNDATRANPKNHKAWNNYGFLLLSSDEPEAAQAALEKAVDLDGTVARYRNNLGLAQASAGKPERALRTFLSTSSRADAHYNVAVALERSDDTPAALFYYEKAAHLDETHADARRAVERLAAKQSADGAQESQMEKN